MPSRIAEGHMAYFKSVGCFIGIKWHARLQSSAVLHVVHVSPRMCLAAEMLELPESNGCSIMHWWYMNGGEVRICMPSANACVALDCFIAQPLSLFSWCRLLSQLLEYTLRACCGLHMSGLHSHVFLVWCLLVG